MGSIPNSNNLCRLMVVSPTRRHAFQIRGGAAYFNDNPSSYMLRDALINQIGEGSNGALASYIALVGCVDRAGIPNKFRRYVVALCESDR